MTNLKRNFYVYLTVCKKVRLIGVQTTSALNKTLCTLTCYLLPINLVPRHSYRPQSLYQDGKNRAVLSSHRDSLLAYRDRFVAVLRRVTLTKLYRRAVICKPKQISHMK
jgi:hypothetical protein